MISRKISLLIVLFLLTLSYSIQDWTHLWVDQSNTGVRTFSVTFTYEFFTMTDTNGIGNLFAAEGPFAIDDQGFLLGDSISQNDEYKIDLRYSI